jgi:hypothetical protein
MSARPSHGECTVGAIAACEIGNLAAGAEAFVIVTIRAADERELATTAIVTAKADDGSTREASALTTTRGVRYAPALSLRRRGERGILRSDRHGSG